MTTVGDAPFIAVRPGSALDVPVLLRRLERRWPLVLAVSVAAFALAVGIVVSLTPRFHAEATLMLEERQARVVAFEQVLSQIPGDSEAVQSEVLVLRSRELLQRTVEQLNLVESPEFNPFIARPKLLDPLKSWIRDGIAALQGRQADVPPTADDIIAGVVSTLYAKLWVEPVPRSRAIRVGLLGEDAALAANIVNTHTRLYVEAQLEAKLRASRSAGAFLLAQAEEMRGRVRKAEEAVEEYRAREGLLQGGFGQSGSLLAAQDLSETTSQLADARKRREESEARLDQAQDPQRRLALPEVVANVLVGRLREQEAQLRQEVTQNGELLGGRHPRVLQLRAALADLEAKIGREVGHIAESVRTEASVRREQERALRERVQQLRNQLARSNAAGVQMAALSREAEAARGLLQAMLNRQQEVSAGEALQQPDAKIISRATEPLSPAYPRTMLFLAAGGVASVCFGLAAGLVPGRTRSGLKSMADVEPLLQTRPLGLVPAVRGRMRSSRYLLDQPESALAESVRGVLTNIVLEGALPRSLLVASALPDEGKTSVALALARLAVHMGYRALLVDADLRRPSLHKAFGAEGKPGLCDFLEGRASVVDIIQGDSESSLKFVVCGDRQTDPARLLNHKVFASAISAWQKSFDLVIFDSSPLALVSDARLLARHCNEVVFVAQWERTHRGLVHAELDGLRSAGARIAGVVLTKVDVRKYARDTYGESGVLHAYYGRRN
jgi:polysaccharide biosynthesis transport protein